MISCQNPTSSSFYWEVPPLPASYVLDEDTVLPTSVYTQNGRYFFEMQVAPNGRVYALNEQRNTLFSFQSDLNEMHTISLGSLGVNQDESGNPITVQAYKGLVTKNHMYAVTGPILNLYDSISEFDLSTERCIKTRSFAEMIAETELVDASYKSVFRHNPYFKYFSTRDQDIILIDANGQAFVTNHELEITSTFVIPTRYPGVSFSSVYITTEEMDFEGDYLSVRITTDLKVPGLTSNRLLQDNWVWLYKRQGTEYQWIGGACFNHVTTDYDKITNISLEPGPVLVVAEGDNRISGSTLTLRHNRISFFDVKNLSIQDGIFSPNQRSLLIEQDIFGVPQPGRPSTLIDNFKPMGIARSHDGGYYIGYTGRTKSGMLKVKGLY
ncbi:MAG: hypothetical protein MI717_06955 [Spirochaetales bacterium]|nr:hypothetical protein [Spirochaetales bacterium]